MKYNLLEDIATLSQIKPAVLNKLTSIIEYCICDYIDNLSIFDEDIAEIDLGFGTLVLCYIDDEVKYQFKPSSKLEKGITKTLTEDSNVLIDTVECNLKKRVSNTYKELF